MIVTDCGNKFCGVVSAVTPKDAAEVWGLTLTAKIGMNSYKAVKPWRLPIRGDRAVATYQVFKANVRSLYP